MFAVMLITSFLYMLVNDLFKVVFTIGIFESIVKIDGSLPYPWELFKKPFKNIFKSRESK